MSATALARLRYCIDIDLIPCLLGEPRLWFEHFLPNDDGVVDLLGVVMAAREPLSSAHLDSLGLLGALSGTDLHSSRQSLAVYINAHSSANDSCRSILDCGFVWRCRTAWLRPTIRGA